jgi:hypothetical protein
MPSRQALGLIARLALSLPIAAASVLVSKPALSQSAADKATARTLATEGIKLYHAGEYAQSLDRLERAQELYQAPVHLLYIARAQVKLGKLVEGAETYRQLVRVTLEPRDPKAFHDALASGKQELPEVETKIPYLRIDIEPEGIEGVQIAIDGKKVPAAAIGVDRPTNPGKRTVRASAPGYAARQQSVEINPGERESVTIRLEPETGAASPAAKGQRRRGSPRVKAAPRGERPESKFGFVAGLRLAPIIPFGTASTDEVLVPDGDTGSGADLSMNQFFRPGFGLEVHVGVQFLKRLTALLFYEANTVRPGPLLEDRSGYPGELVVLNTTSSAEAAGLGLQMSFPLGKLALFGELALAALHTFDSQQRVSVPNRPECSSHENSLAFGGSAAHLGGGVHIPITSWFRASPMLMLSIGQFFSFEAKAGCVEDGNLRPVYVPAGETEVSKDIEAPRTHGALFIGVAGDVLFGGGNPAR